jgi:F0F1-type ATP synthase assembly protein I
MIAMKETIYYSTILNIRDYLNDMQKEEIRKDIQERIDNLKSYAMQETSDIQEARQKYTIYQELIGLI